jgi:hypothetical protein
LVAVIAVIRTSPIAQTGAGIQCESSVAPAVHEPGPVAECRRRIFRERAEPWPRHRHFAQHAHDQEHQHPAQGVADQYGGPGHADRRRTADEQASADDAAQRNHRYVPRLQCMCKRFGCDRQIWSPPRAERMLNGLATSGKSEARFKK